MTSKGLWEASISLGRRADGSRYRLHAYGATKKEALAKLRKLQESPRCMTGDKVSVAGYIDIWLADRERSVAFSTHRRYEQVAEYPKKYLGHYQMKDVGPPHVRQWYADMSADKVTASTQAKSAQLMSMIFKSAMADLVCLANPCSVVSAPRTPKHEITFLTPEQISVFLEASDRCRMFALYKLALGTGARLGEMLALTWKDINFEAGTVTFRRTLSEVGGTMTVKETKTTNSQRTVELPQFAIEALHEHHKQLVTEGLASCPLVFPTKRGTYMRRSNIHQRYYKPTLKRAGLPVVKFHCLRHSAATWLLSLGATAKDVASILGHANASFTINTYTHTLKASRTAAVAAMDKSLADGGIRRTQEEKPPHGGTA
ncbi:MAG: tyrosine-type recombinase/integrase [Pirellulaceae bacterium]